MFLYHTQLWGFSIQFDKIIYPKGRALLLNRELLQSYPLKKRGNN